MLKDMLKFSGKLNINLIDNNGKEKINCTYNNLVVSSGISYIINRMVSNNSPRMVSMAIGSGNSIPQLNNSTLQSEIYRIPLSSSVTSANSVTYVATFPPGAGIGSLKEAGIFNSTLSNSGTMLCRTAFPEMNKEGGDTLIITWNVSGE